jgi:hypothetical protein
MMFHRIQQYRPISVAGQWYRPRAYGQLQPDGTWDGWIVFFALNNTSAIAPPTPETTQSTLEALTVWATALTPVYLEGAIARALDAQHHPVLAELSSAEYEALADAESLESAAESDRAAADLDEAAARAARADAEQIRRERLATEGAIAATEAATAEIDAHRHEQAARDARAIAADAADRARSALADATPRRNTKRGRRKKT